MAGIGGEAEIVPEDVEATAACVDDGAVDGKELGADSEAAEAKGDDGDGSESPADRAKLFNKLGTLMQAKGDLAGAERSYRAALKADAGCVFALYNLASLLGNCAESVSLLQAATVARPAFSEAWQQLGACFLKSKQLAEAEDACRRSLALPGSSHAEAFFNLSTVLRLDGRQEQAIEEAWKRLEDIEGEAFEPAPRLTAAPSAPAGAVGVAAEERAGESGEDSKAGEDGSSGVVITVVCVKWGTKYGADYVNKLARGVARWLTLPYTFVCFTDDRSGLMESVETRELPRGWKGWWNKATLFAADADLRGRVLYIDLDSVIVGSLDALASWRGTFALLGTDNLHNEQRTGGFNSSVMLWPAGWGSAIHDYLLRHRRPLADVIHRLDHWLEMLVPDAAILQDELPGAVVEFVAEAREAPPPGAAIVTFPLEPKPHSADAAWIAELWK